MLTSNIQLGRTKVLTRFEMFLRSAAVLLALFGSPRPHDGVMLTAGVSSVKDRSSDNFPKRGRGIR